MLRLNDDDDDDDDDGGGDGYSEKVVRDVEDGETLEARHDGRQLDEVEPRDVERGDGARVDAGVGGHAREHGVTRVVGRQQQRVVAEVDVDDRLGQHERRQRVARHVQRAQRVAVVEVLGQRVELVGAGEQRLERAQLAHVGRERPESVAGDVERRQQLNDDHRSSENKTA